MENPTCKPPMMRSRKNGKMANRSTRFMAPKKNCTFLGAQVKRICKVKKRYYSMPQRVGHASLGNLELLHQKANGSTIVSTHCEQENDIT